MIRTKRRAAQLLAMTGVLLGGMLTFSPSASAGTSCSYPFCSETFNKDRQYEIIVAHDWCGNLETMRQDAPPCGWNDQTIVLWPGQHTNPNEDWDVLRVDPGWVYTVQVYSVLTGWSSVGSFDNRGISTPLWVRVHNDETMYVLSQHQ